MPEIDEKTYTYAECEAIYGTTDVKELNRRFEEESIRATDGNCGKWAIYAVDKVKVFVEC